MVFILQTLHALLRDTLRVIPDSVLDDSPKLEESAVSLFADLSALPSAHPFGSSRTLQPPQQSLEDHSTVQFLGVDLKQKKHTQ